MSFDPFRLNSANQIISRYYPGANAGFFIWIDLRPYLPKCSGDNPWDGENKLVNKLIENKVFITNGQMLAAEEPGWFRVIFSVDREVIKAGLERVFKVIGIKGRTETVQSVH